MTQNEDKKSFDQDKIAKDTVHISTSRSENPDGNFKEDNKPVLKRQSPIHTK